METMLLRLTARLADEGISSAIVAEMLQTAIDRITLRLGVTELPKEMASIAVEVATKLIRRRYHEGITSETADTLNTSFEADVLAEYEPSFKLWLENQKLAKVVRFI